MPLSPGDILFVGWDSDNDDIEFISTVDLAAGEVIYFTDNEWNGNNSSFNSGEGLVEWTVPTGGVAAGRVVNLNFDPTGFGTGTASVSTGTLDVVDGVPDIAGGNEMLWAFQGTRSGTSVTPTNFVSVIANEANGGWQISPDLNNTGLTTSNGAIIIDGDEDYMEWTGDTSLTDPVDRQDLIDSILDTTNWTTADGGGNSNPNGTGFDVDDQNVICFTAGTLIETALGPRPVEFLKAGDLVLTADHGLQPIRWIGGRRLGLKELAANPKLRPVRIEAGALGSGLPERDLLVSRQHRVLIRSKIAVRMFDATEILIPAIKLTEVPGVFVDEDVDCAEYFHMLFDKHQIIYAEGTPAESLFTGPGALNAISQRAREEIRLLFPEAAELDHAPVPVRFMPPGKMQKQLIVRHIKNRQPLINDNFRGRTCHRGQFSEI